MSDCKFWLNKAGQIIADDNGVPIYSAECPCGECCERLWNNVAGLLSQTYKKCVSCDLPDEGCGECDAGDDPFIFEPGKYIYKAVNPLMSFTAPCNSGFEVTSAPAGGGDTYEQDEMVTISFCDHEAQVPFSYTDGVGVSCRMVDGVAERCTMFANAYCERGDRMLYPVIPAPDPVSSFSNPSTIVCQQYWVSCFDPNPYFYVRCAVQIIAARDTFDDYTGDEPDDTLVWGVIGCFCEGNDKWTIKRLGGAGNGLIVVNAPFEAELTDKLDANDQPILDENDEPIQVVKCAITCQGQKDLVKEMLEHYTQVVKEGKTAVRATIDPNEWYDWTEETVTESCFWGYIPFSVVYGYVCQHPDDQGVIKSYNHWIAFDCDCVMYEIESDNSGGGISLPDAGIYETKNDVCGECPAIWALLAYAQGEGWSLSQSTDSDPRDSGDGGVIVQRDYRVPGGNIYSIGGTPTYLAAWGTANGRDYLIWIDCDCEPHVDCDGNKKFIASVDPCICVDWREIVDANRALFGVVDAEWGSHTYVEWTHTDATRNYSGPYWLYGATESTKSPDCDPCNPPASPPTWVQIDGGFIDYNMLVVHRVVNGEHEIGHVQQSGGIINYRLQQAGASMQGIVSAQVGGQDVEVMDENFSPGAYCDSSRFLGWQIVGYRYRAFCIHATSIIWCDCDETQWGDDRYLCEYAATHAIHPDTAFFWGGDINGTGTLPYSKAKRVSYSERHQETDCAGNCHWEPSSERWGMFQVQYLPTSCGLMVLTESGKVFVPSLSIPGYQPLTQWARSKIESQYGYFEGASINGYPYTYDTEITGMRTVEVRNSRGTLVSYQIYGAPGTVQPPLCHGSKCNSVGQSYQTLDAYCQAHPEDDGCKPDDPIFDNNN